MSRSLNIHEDCIERAKLALKRNGFHSQRALAESVGFSLSTVGNFLRGKPVDFATFVELCGQLSLDWQQVSGCDRNTRNIDDPDNLIPVKPTSARTRYQDWGEAIDVSSFYGRSSELLILQSWIQDEACRLITILGMGGMGKTALAVKLAHQLQDQFDTVIFRSLWNAPSLEPFLANLIKVLSHHQETSIFESLSDLLSRFVQYLQKSRCLLILDNVESILEVGSRTGTYRKGYEDYGQLLKLIGETAHKSCLVLTSREKPQGLSMLEGDQLPVRCLRIHGLSTQASRAVFNSIGSYTGDEQDWSRLVERYRGNPLALKIIASFIRNVFEHDLSQFLEFLQTEPFIFDDIKDLLDQQFRRLSPVETEIMYWLAIQREPVSCQDLQSNIIFTVPIGELLQAIAALQNRSLIEKSGDCFSLQPVVMEYVTLQLIQHTSESLLQNQIGGFIQYPFVQAQSSVSVRDTQRRLILQAIVDNLLVQFGSPTAVIERLYAFLMQLRGRSAQETGYFCSNLLYLAKHMEVDVNGYDFSGLTVWQANLQGMSLQNTNFADANFRHSTFSEILDEVKAVTFSPNGQYLAIADQDCKVRVWCPQTSQQLWVGHEHHNSVLSVAFSPDSKLLASASADHTLKLWDTRTSLCLETFSGHDSEVYAAAFSPDGQYLVSGSKDCTVKVWDVSSGACIQTLTGHQQAIFTVACNGDGSVIASGSSDQTIKLWDTKAGTCQRTLPGHANWVMSVAFCPHTDILGSCSTDHTIKLWDYRQGQCEQTLRGHTNWVLSLAFSPDGKTLVSSSGDQTVKLWDVSQGRCLQTLSGHHHGVLAVAFSPDGRTVASGSHDQTVRLWQVETGACLKVLTGYTNRIFAVASSPDGLTIASGSFDQSICLWDRRRGQLLRSLKGHYRPVYALAFSPKGQMLASGGGDCALKLWHYPTGQCISTLTGHRGWIYALTYSPDGEWLVSGGSDHTIKIWRVSTEDCVMTLTGHQTWIWSVDVSPDGRHIASGSGDRTIKLWDIRTGACLKTLTGHEDRVYSVAFSPDGLRLASGSFDHTIKLWDLETGQCLQSLTGHTNGVYTVAFSPEGTNLASGSLDHTIKYWELMTGDCLKTYVGHENEVRSLTFLPPLSSQDNQPLQLASGSQDQSLRIWHTQTGDCQVVLKVKPLYDRMNITGTVGLTNAQKASLKVLGAYENFDPILN